MAMGFFRGSPARLASVLKYFRAPSRRPLLIAHWSIAADGVLECRWERVERQFQAQR